MKALHVYRTYFPDSTGGIEEAIRQIALATAALGVENTVFALSTRPEPAEMVRPEARVVRERSWAAPASCDLGGPAAFRRFAALARGADVVVYHYPWPLADVLHAAVRPGAPAVMLYHSDIVRQRWLGMAYAPLMRRTLRAMSAIVATSPAYARTSPVLTAPDLRDKVCVIPLGMGDDARDGPGDPAILARLGLGEGEPFVLFVGVLRYYKGLHVLLQAAASVGARIVIAGSGPKDAELRAQAARDGVGNVLFAGQVTDAEKTALFRHCRVFVLPSHLRSEAYGMVLVEAAMFGRPMVSCEVGSGTSFVNAHGESGLVVPPEDASALAAALNTLLDDAALAARYGREARARYERLFSRSALGRSYVELFERLRYRQLA
ncbi:MAG: glycosyltransferase [Acidovorax sp.]|uniref:glycosyltransferase n=1 Tax=Acidovorax sp. TaxID=1872122 RepID=UPI0039E376ED